MLLSVFVPVCLFNRGVVFWAPGNNFEEEEKEEGLYTETRHVIMTHVITKREIMHVIIVHDIMHDIMHVRIMHDQDTQWYGVMHRVMQLMQALKHERFMHAEAMAMLSKWLCVR